MARLRRLPNLADPGRLTFLTTLSSETSPSDLRAAAKERWSDALAVLRDQLPERPYHTWFGPVRFLEEGGDAIRIQVPNATFAKRIEGEYHDCLLAALRAVGCRAKEVRCEVRESPDAAPEGTSTRSEPLSVSSSFDSFVVGSSNRCAHAASLAVSDPGVMESPYNPLLIYGDVGLGKTHLLQSIARRLLDHNPDRRVLYTKGEAFTRQVVNAVRTQNLYAFRDQCAGLDALLVDDLHFIAGLDRFGRSTEEFFHTLNALSERGQQVVVTANAHPQDIHNLDSRIRSRLESGLAADIGRPEWETRVAIVARKATAIHVELPSGAAEKIASRYRNNVRELEGALNRIIAAARAEGAEISNELVERVLSGLPSKRSQRPSVRQVMAATSTAFGVPLLRLAGMQRSQDLVLARHVAMYICREVTNHTLKEIGREFRRDHSSVTYGIRRVEHQRSRDPGLDRLVERMILQFF